MALRLQWLGLFTDNAARGSKAPRSFRAEMLRGLLVWVWVGTSFRLAGADETTLRRFEKAEIRMGMTFALVLYAADEGAANRGFTAVFARIEQLNRVASDYDPDSELSRLCDQAPTAAPVPVSADLAWILQRSLEWSDRTEGAFDVTVGPLTKLWRRARRTYQVPDRDRIQQELSAVGYRHLVLHSSDRTVELLRPRMRLDLGGIVPGYAADEALRLLREQGIARALVNASGDLAVGDPPPGERAWRIELAPDRSGPGSRRVVWLRNAAVSTSGDAYQFLEADGVRYSHILDPRTGYGLTERRSASVIAGTGLEADCLATAVCVLGPERGLALVETLPRAAAWTREWIEPGLQSRFSSRFPDYERQP